MAEKSWYRRPFLRWRIFRGVPMSRLWVLLLAAFLLFSVNGFYTDLMSRGTIPHAVVFMISTAAGLDAVLWILVFARCPAWAIVPMIVLQFLMGTIITDTDVWMRARFHLSAVSSEAGIRFAATMMFWVTIAAYASFLRYIIREGSHSLRVQNELELAHGIQKTLVPPLQLSTPRFEIYGISSPSEHVGGDLVDAVTLRPGEVIAYIADITGHGLAASILMGRVKTAARTALLDSGEHMPQETLPLLLNRLNTVLPQVKEPTMYATFTGFRLCGDGSVFCALAASPPVVHWQASGQAVSKFEEPQFPVGMFSASQFDGFPVPAAAGDLFVVATDGILEVANKREEEFGLERLNELIASGAHDALPELAARILDAARAYGRQIDDQTLLLVRCL